MQRFELVEGTSSKFWEISREGSGYRVRYGRIGSNGQRLEKTAASEEKARAEVEKLIREKTAKGYVEVALAPDATLATVAATAPHRVTPAPTPTVSPAVESATSAAVTASPATSAPQSAATAIVAGGSELRMPSGAFQFSAAWRKAMPPQRGYPVQSTAPDLVSLWVRLPRFTHADRRQWEWAVRNLGLEALIKRHPPATLLTEASLAGADPQRWQIAFQLGRVIYDANYEVAGGILVELCVALHGVAFATEHFLRAMAQLPDTARTQWFFGGGLGVDELVAALARCSDEDYARAREAVLRIEPATDNDRFMRGAVFNSEIDWVAEALRCSDSDPLALGSVSMLAGARLTLLQAETLVKSMAMRGHQSSVRLALNLARLHGAAALPMVARLFDQQNDPEPRRRLADILRAFDSHDACAELLDRIEFKEARAQLDAFAQDWPLAAMQAAAGAIARSRSGPAEAWLSRMLAAHPALLEPLRTSMEGAALAVLDRLRSKLVDLDEAPPDALPAVLRDPPWLKPQPRRSRPSLADTPLPAPRMQWPDGLRDGWRRLMPADAGADHDPKHDRHGESLEALCVPRPLWPALLSGELTDLAAHLAAIETYRAGEAPFRRCRFLSSLEPLPANLRLLLWNTLPGWESYSWDGAPTPGTLIAHYELDALPGLLNFLDSRLESGLVAALPVAAAGIAPFAAKGLAAKKSRPHAAAWLRAHAELATTALLQQSATAHRPASASADAALRWLAANVDPQRLQQGARHFGDAGEALLDVIVATDPLSVLPQKARPLPSFYLPGGFARPRLHDGRAVPAAALPALGTMLQVSLLDEAYAGLDDVKAACSAQSLDEFAWDLFQAWYQSGAASKESWAFTAMGLIAGDGCVRQLTPLLREWPGQAQHARAVTGLDILAAIGSDLALMNLNGIAQKAKFKGLQQRAREKIQAIADARDLTAEELADRLVPDFDLDAAGTLHLDFGPRRFTVGFDEQLRPFVLDADGARLKDLPKPGKTDDGELAKAACERWKLLKKDVKAIANTQIQRLEQVMCSGRSFDAAVFRRFFVEHPLMRHLARRLLWGVQAEDGSVRGFRVAEDLSFADRDDMQFELDADARVCLPHVLNLDAAQQAAFGQIFSDYEILQPFVQLGREVLKMDADELDQHDCCRFRGKRVAVGSVYGLQHRGWRHGSPQDAGWIGWFEKSLPGGLEVQLELDPGTVVGDISYEPKQTLGTLSLRVANTWDDAGRRRFADLDAVVRSELLRDIDRLAVLVE